MSSRVADICEINGLNLSMSSDWKYINYLDTANLNVGTIDELSYMEIGKDKIPSRAKRIVRKNDILISTVRPNQKHFGIIKNAPKNLVVSTGFAVITPNEKKVDPGYLYNFLVQEHITTYLHSIAESSTSAYPSIRPSVIAELELELPSLEEQKAIAHILSTLDEKIEVNNRINKILEEMAQAIFKHWFVDFEFPNEDGEPYMSSGGEMVKSDLGLIPKGWQVSFLDKIAEYLNGLAMQKYRPDDLEEGVPVLKIKELRQGFTDSSSDVCSNDIDGKYIINNGDVIFSWSGSLLVDLWAGGKCGLNQHLFKVTSTNFDKWFYYIWTKYYLEKFQEIAKSKATTMGHIKRKDLSDSRVLIPENHFYNVSSKLFKPLYELVITNKVENAKLISIRDTILPKLMSGEIRVPLDIEEQ